MNTSLYGKSGKMSSPSQPVSTISTGGAGGNGATTSNSIGMVATAIPPRVRQYPWPLPGSAYQGAVGGAGGIGMVQVAIPPPTQVYWSQYPYRYPQIGYLPSNPVKL